ncbi:MAG: transporter substrate-binding domain-containing protein [Sneathiella sp.]
MRLYFIKYALCFSVFLFSVYGLVNQSNAQVKLTTSEYPPYTSQSLKNGGIATDIVRQVFKKMGEEIEVDLLPWKRGYEAVEKGNYVATYPLLKTAERENKFLYSDPIILWESKLFVHRDTNMKFEDWEDLEGHVECLPLGFAAIPQLRKLYVKKKIHRVVPRDCWKMILNGRADFFVEDVLVGEIVKKKALGAAANQVIPLKKAVSLDFGYVVFPKKRKDSAELVQRFNKALKELILAGSLQKIRPQEENTH